MIFLQTDVINQEQLQWAAHESR